MSITVDALVHALRRGGVKRWGIALAIAAIPWMGNLGVSAQGLGSMPVLLYWDTDDPSAILKGGSGAVDMKGGLALFDLLAAKSKNVRLLISKGGGHFPYRLHTEEFNQNLANFIDVWKQQSTTAKPSAGRN